MTGHTHEDVDQLFGQLARHLLREVALLTPPDFVTSINTFLGRSPSSHEKWSRCVKLDKVHDWADWLRRAPLHLQGTGGPGAPHEFRFLLRADCASIIETPAIHSMEVSTSNDVILTLKRRMSDMKLMLPALMYMPASQVDLLRDLGGPSRLAEKNPVGGSDGKVKQELLKFADAIRKPPFSLSSASDYMTAWLNGCHAQAPELDISYVVGRASGTCAAVTRPALDPELVPLQMEPDLP